MLRLIRLQFLFAILSVATLRSGAAEIDDAIQALIQTDPSMHFMLKDKSGRELGMNKWSNDKLTVFMLTVRGRPMQTVASDAAVEVPAVLKDQEYRVLVSPPKQREVDGKTVEVAAVYESRTRKVCASPQFTEYKFKGQTVLTYRPYEIGHDTDKTAPVKGKISIGADEYDVFEAFNVVKDK